MKALLLAATSSLALTGFAMAQTTTDTTTTTDSTAAVPATGAPTEADSAATGAGTNAGGDMGATTGTAAGDAAATAGDKIEDAADSAENAVDSTMTTGAADTAEDAADRAEDAADAAVTPGASVGDTATTTTTMPMDATTTSTGTAATTTTDMATTTAADAGATTMLTPDNPGMLGSWIMKRRIWTTNQPSSTAWESTTMTERPAEWTDIAKVDDIVVDPSGNIVGYVADIGGFLGLGAKSVLLSPDALHFVQAGDDAFFATNYTREELEALPDFDTTTVMR